MLFWHVGIMYINKNNYFEFNKLLNLIAIWGQVFCVFSKPVTIKVPTHCSGSGSGGGGDHRPMN